LTAAAIALLLLWAYALAGGAVGAPSFCWLRRSPPAVGPLPPLTVVLAARDEAAGIGACLASLLASRHPDLRIIAVDDRSRDGTGEIMDRMAGGRLQVLHVADLPQGWLGKNHALWAGARAKPAPWLLFSDGDVVFHPDAIARGHAWAIARGADHLAVAPQLIGGGWLLKAVEGVFTTFLTSVLRVGQVASRRSSAYFGVGAFNLIRAEVYQAIGTHAAIALRPDDDVMLGRLVKRGGFHSVVGLGQDMVRVPWYRTLGEMAHGFEKNALAPSGYRPWLAGLVGVLVLAAFEAPFILLLTPARAIAAAAAAMALALYLGVNRTSGVPPWTAVLLPVSAALLIGLYLRAVILTAVRGEIRWRGRSYRLRDLR
jgi:uncharacterized protein YodC (DUF2158 family)